MSEDFNEIAYVYEAGAEEVRWADECGEECTPEGK